MFVIARSEFVQILRNRSVLVSGLVMPLAASVYFIYFRDTFEEQGSLGYIGAVLVFTIGAFSLYATTVTTLAARRQNLFLKRLRSTAASDPAPAPPMTSPGWDGTTLSPPTCCGRSAGQATRTWH